MTMTQQNIAIIGAGIIGIMCARTLRDQGHTVTLYNKDGFPPTSSASYIAGGMLAPYSEIDHMTPDFIGACLHSIDLWRDFIKPRPDVHFTDKGSLLIAHQEDLHMLQRFAHHLPNDENKNVWETLSRPQLEDKESALPSKFQQGLWLKQEAAIHPQNVISALHDEFTQDEGMTLIAQSVTPNDIAGHFDHIIDARGDGAMHDDQNLRGVKGEIAIVHNPDVTFTHTVRIMHPRYPLYIVPRRNHVYMIGATQIETSQDDALSLRSAMELLSTLYSLHPSFADAKILGFHTGIRPSYSDNLPRITQRDNIITCNGTYRHGILLAPSLAEGVANAVQGTKINPIYTKPLPNRTQKVA